MVNSQQLCPPQNWNQKHPRNEIHDRHVQNSTEIDSRRVFKKSHYPQDKKGRSKNHKILALYTSGVEKNNYSNETKEKTRPSIRRVTNKPLNRLFAKGMSFLAE
jgi:hypothetical protein